MPSKYLNRSILVCGIFGQVFAAPTGSGAQSITVEGIARSVTLFDALAENCPGINRPLARRYASAFEEVGIKAESKAEFAMVLPREKARRAREFRAEGRAVWCSKAREEIHGFPNGEALFRP